MAWVKLHKDTTTVEVHSSQVSEYLAMGFTSEATEPKGLEKLQTEEPIAEKPKTRRKKAE